MDNPFPRILIGLAAEHHSENLSITLDAIRNNTALPYQLLTLGPAGAPACFNRLISENNADLYVFMESGVRPAPEWLERLIESLCACPQNGLSGPSTNRAWNAQAAFPAAGGGTEQMALTARLARQKFGAATRTLEPLFSLCDFCYAVRREVVEVIGPADESYGLGPCWEMDYNIRAARAGWRGVWACSSFVWRALPTPESRRQEARLFQASKQRYQDKFCGARLRGQKHDYRSHCRGDACPNFAPLEFQDRWRANAPSPPPAQPPRPPAEVVASAAPLASCIMPTCDRRSFISGAIRNFLAQDYPNLELLILDDGTDSVADLAPPDARIRYIRFPEKKILGDKRNLACAQARGEFVCHWDDDDWYPPNRVSRQVAALQAGSTQICGSSRVLYYDPAAQRAWLYAYAGGARSWVAGNTLAYRRSFWQAHPFAHVQIGEDSRFVWAGRSSAIADLKDAGICVARLHPGNTSRKALAGHCWQPIALTEVERLAGLALHHFQILSSDSLPMVSCIMPTANRRHFVPLALRCFERQDYPRKELIIVDDGLEDLSGLVAGRADVQYVRLLSRQSIGAKRNLACHKARGSIIAHWDDDDWYAPERLTRQIEPLLRGESDLTGLESDCVFDAAEKKFWKISPQLHERMFVGNVHGGTLVFRKSIFDKGARYPELNLAEDAAFIRLATRQRNRLARVANSGLFVYVRHGANAWSFVPGRFLDAKSWQETACPPAFLSFLPEYEKKVVDIKRSFGQNRYATA